MTEIQLFRFDSKTDYLPYYKKFQLKLNPNETISTLLDKLNEKEKFSYLKNETFFLKVNSIFISSETTIDEVLCGTKNELIIEPISIKRAVNDLIIDIKDYKQKLELLNNYISIDEKASIIQEKRYMLDYYASNTLHFNDDYIGEHVLFLASELIQNNPELTKELSTLVDTENGIKIRTSLNYRIINSNEENLKSYPLINSNPKVQQKFSNFNIALYCGMNNTSFENVIKKSGASYIDLVSKHFDIPQVPHNTSYLIAGSVLLEAFDNNADFLIVNDQEELKLFDAKQKKIAKTMGREIDLPVLTQEEFLQLLQGNKELTNHKIKIPFLAA